MRYEVKVSGSVYEALQAVPVDSPQRSSADQLVLHLFSVCTDTALHLFGASKAKGKTPEMMKTSLAMMVFSPESFDQERFDALRTGTSTGTAGGFCIESGKTIKEIKASFRSSRFVDLNQSTDDGKQRLFDLYVQQYMASGDPCVDEILKIFDVKA